MSLGRDSAVCMSGSNSNRRFKLNPLFSYLPFNYDTIAYTTQFKNILSLNLPLSVTYINKHTHTLTCTQTCSDSMKFRLRIKQA